MSLASICIIAATLFVFGILYLFMNSLNQSASTLNNKLEILVYCNYQLEDSQANTIEDTIKSDNNVQSYIRVSKDTALNNYKASLGEDGSVLDGMDSSFLPISFKVKLKDSSLSKEFMDKYEKLSGVDKVKYSQRVVDLFSKINYWARFLSAMLIVVLLVVSLFIISNTIKLTVFARRREINIMKYIGATDWFIRWPFVIEGVVIGLFGGLIAFVLTSFLYNMLANKISIGFGFTQGLIKFVSINDIGVQLAGIFALIGISVGGIGSLISIRKHLHV
jgi:cell division transport system permease protein